MDERELLDQIYDTLFQNHLDNRLNLDKVKDQTIYEGSYISIRFDDDSCFEINVRKIPRSWMD